jgi:hypothetical protein
MKIFWTVVVLWTAVAPKTVYRIIRPPDLVHVSFQNDKFKQIVDFEITNFDKITDAVDEEVRNCLIKNIANPEAAQVVCLGDNFARFRNRFLLATFRINSIFEHLLDLLVTQNCIIYHDSETQCYQLLQDIKVLIQNDYDVLSIVDANQSRYLTATLTQERFDALFDLLVYLVEKFDAYHEHLNQLSETMIGKIWIFYREDIVNGKVKLANGEGASLSQTDMDVQALIERVNKAVEDKFSDANSEYRSFIEIEGAHNPFADDDAVAQAKIEEAAEARYEENKQNVAERFTKQVDGLAKVSATDCSAIKDYEGCIRDKIRAIFRERTVKKQATLL